jgi:hypothetical protein
VSVMVLEDTATDYDQIRAAGAPPLRPAATVLATRIATIRGRMGELRVAAKRHHFPGA